VSGQNRAVERPKKPTGSTAFCTSWKACPSKWTSRWSTRCWFTRRRPTSRATAQLLAKTREERTAINKHLIFFDLEWIHLADEPACALISHPKLGKYRHYLEQKARLAASLPQRAGRKNPGRQVQHRQERLWPPL